MRPEALIVGLGIASMVMGSLCACSYRKYFPPEIPTLPNAVAIDRALRLCSLTEGEMPFHAVLEIAPRMPVAETMRTQGMRAQVEVFWMNPSTYRTVIHSQAFSQTRIVNGVVVEEHDAGDFYPRWIQNFVDALLEPVPQSAALRTVEGTVPVGATAHACISRPYQAGGLKDGLGPEDAALEARVCFMDDGPMLASGEDFTRHVSFDDFAAFGSKQVARLLVNVLPANTLVDGRIVRLEPLDAKDYRLLKTKEYTWPAKQIQTKLVPESVAQSMLISPFALGWPRVGGTRSEVGGTDGGQDGSRTQLYIRTDRTGRVREVYRDKSDIYGLQNSAVAAAFGYRFKPLVIRGVSLQMEAPISFPATAPPRP